LEKENYKDEFCKEMQKIFALKRDVDGLFVSDEKNQEELLAEVSFEAKGDPFKFIVDKQFVESKLSDQTMAYNLKKYIL